MWFMCMCILVFCTNFASCIFEKELSVITDNFFDNLYSDPFLEKHELSEISEKFIDEKVDIYVNLIKEKYGARHNLKRRSINDESKKRGEYVVESARSVEIFGKDKFQDVVIFKDKEEWFAASLKSSDEDVKLCLHKYNGTFFNLQSENLTESAAKVFATSNDHGSFVISTEDKNAKIYVVQNGELKKIQTIQISYISDIYLWENPHGFFMGITTNAPNNKKGLSYVYKWLGRHFDEVDKFHTLGATSITAFTIGNSEFLAIANFEDDRGNYEIHSHIYKYNLHDEKYEIHQKIASNGAVDIKFSSFVYNGVKEHFLIVVNAKTNIEDQSTFAVPIVYKFIDNYFIPFDSLAIRDPTKAAIISPPKGGILLAISSTTDGLSMYSYDGWTFDEMVIFLDDEEKEYAIDSLKFYTVGDMPILVVFTSGEMQFYELKFKLKEQWSGSEEDSIVSWCEDALMAEELQRKKTVEVATPGELKEHPAAARSGQKEAEILGGSLDYTDSDFEELQEIDASLDQKIKQLNEIENELKNLISSDNTFGNVYADEIIVNNKVDFNNLDVNTINEIGIKTLLEGKIDLYEKAELESLNFESAKITNKTPKSLNGNKKEDLLCATDEIITDKLVVHGDIIIKDGLSVTGTLNGVNISSSNILLKNGPQIFENVFNINEIQAENITAHLVNSKSYPEKIVITQLDNLRVKNLSVDHINKVKIPVLDEYALKVTGNQHVTAAYEIEAVNVDDIIINGKISGEGFDDLVRTSTGNYSLKSVKFSNDVTMDKLNVKSRLDGIKINKGKLDVLRSNHTKMQYVTGEKTFENVNSSSIQFLGPINNELLRKSNPVIMIDDVLTVQGDYIIDNATVEELLQAFDIKLQSGKHSLGDIERKGLLLSDEVVEMPMKFTQYIEVENINADIINGLQTSSLIINGNEEVQKITGNITINSDLTITGNTNIEKINDTKLQDFEKTVLNIDDEQTLTGNYHIEKLSADALNSEAARLGNNLWNNTIHTDKNVFINGSTTVNSVKIKNIETENIITNIINGINLNDILNNAAKDGVEILKGRKSFDRITVENLRTKDHYDLEKIPNEIESARNQYNIDELTLKTPMKLNVENINIKGRINDMDASQFEKGWLQSSEDHEFSQEASFDNVTIIGNCTIQSRRINDLHLRDLLENTVKVYEDFEFDEVEFDNFVFAQGQIVLEGDIEGLDLDSAVTQRNEVIKMKTFNGEVIVNGSLTFNGLVNGLNYTDLCQFVLDQGDSLYNLHVNGSVIFTKGPNITNINHRPVREMADNIWFRDQEAIFTGQPDFEEAHFTEKVQVEGRLSGISLSDLSTNYFSKSQNQTIPTDLNFARGVHFSGGLSAGNLATDGHVCGVDIEKFLRTAILNGPQQTFEDTVLVDAIEIDDLQGVYLVNNLNLDKDVMRYDVKNMVTGRKTVTNLVANELVVNKNYLVQGVDILAWMQDSVRRNEGGSVSGSIIFEDQVEFSKGIGVPGKVNGLTFDNQTILLKNIPQEITGNLTFNVEPGKDVYFRNMQLGGMLNGVDINLLLKGQIYDTDSTKLSSPVNINNSIIVDNIEIQKYYNGVNITELLHNLTAYTFENYYNNYANLLNISHQIQDSFVDPPNYLAYYKELAYRSEQSMSFVDIVKGRHRDLAVFYLEISGNCYLNYFGWDDTYLLFELEEMSQISCETSHVSILNLANDSYIYMETSDTSEGYLYNYQARDVAGTFEISETTSAHSFTITETGQHCIIFGSVTYYTRIFCMLENEMTLMQEFHLRVSKIDSIQSSTTFLITATKHDMFDSYVTIWEYNIDQQKFVELQIMHVTSFSSMSAVNYRENFYLAIASDHLKGTKYPGEIQIRKLKPSTKKFVLLQTIEVESPIEVNFAILPSNELVLYAETQGVMESFVVYIYEGIFGFQEKVSAKVSGQTFHPVTINGNNHLVIVHDENVKVLQATFKTLP